MPDRTQKTPIVIDELEKSELYGVVLQSRDEDQPLDPSVILGKLLAAEDYYERELAISFQPRRVFCDIWGRQNGAYPAGQCDLPGDFEEGADLDDTAYDFESRFFSYDRWGEIQLNFRPVRDISRLVFAFPGLSPIYNVAKKHLRIVRKTGRIQIIPVQGDVLLAPLWMAIFSLGMGGGSRGVPQIILADYTIGFTDDELRRDHQDLLEGVRLRTLLYMGGIISTIASPGGQTGGSLSLDGLSHSRQFGGKLGAHGAKIQMAIDREAEILDSWRRRQKGIPVAFA